MNRQGINFFSMSQFKIHFNPKTNTPFSLEIIFQNSKPIFQYSFPIMVRSLPGQFSPFTRNVQDVRGKRHLYQHVRR